MRDRFTKFVRNEFVDESFAKGERILLSVDARFDRAALLCSRFVPPGLQLIKRLNLSLIAKSAYKRSHVVMEGSTPRHNNAHRDSAIAMQTLEILKVSIEEGIFVVPLNLKSDGTSRKSSNVIDFV